MAIIQCKQCGGAVDISEGITYGTCPYCGSLTTFPRIIDDRTEQLYIRAENFRKSGDFDKAAATYESLIQMNPEEPEYYWGIVLARYGIEYVEDPVSHERIPTCHRVQIDSILADSDYQKALELAPSNYEQDIYQQQAARIAEIQKDILQISSKEEPYDVFICYKETTDDGSRTRDSILAQDVYYQLTNIGYKVFFARLTLENKLGHQYEPYIFAALNSAKVMLVIGSQKEFFEAAWVRNEWSRFLALMKRDRSKLLIPCYSGMDPYDLPVELSMFQAQDMTKIGFLQDLIHGIKKIVGKEEPSAVANANSSIDSTNATSTAIENLLKRIKFFLSERNFSEAKEYCYRVLDSDPDNMEAYYCQCLAELQMSNETDFQEESDFTGIPEELGCYKKIMASDNAEMKDKIEKLADFFDRTRCLRLAYYTLDECEEDMNEKNIHDPFLRDLACVDKLKFVAAVLRDAGDLKDAPQLLEDTLERLYTVVVRISDESVIEEIADPNLAKHNPVFCRVLSWHEIKSSPLEYRQTMNAINDDDVTFDEQDRLNDEFVANDFKKDKLYGLIFDIFDALDDYRDSAELEQEFNDRDLSADYSSALHAIQNNDWTIAVFCLKRVGDFRDAPQLLEDVKPKCYELGVQFMNAKRYNKAANCFFVLEDYENADELLAFCESELKKKKIIIIVCAVIAVIILGIIIM